MGGQPGPEGPDKREGIILRQVSLRKAASPAYRLPCPVATPSSLFKFGEPAGGPLCFHLDTSFLVDLLREAGCPFRCQMGRKLKKNGEPTPEGERNRLAAGS